MYYYIKGTLARLEPTFAVIDCAGVGYRLAVSASTHASLAPLLGRNALLYTYLAVREDALELYGFFDETEKRVFTYLISVSGVGPKGAMSVLSVMSASRLASFVAAGDAKAIASAPGVGLKTAQKIIIELKDKLSDSLPAAESGVMPQDGGGTLSEAVNALTVLGFTRAQAMNALKGADMSQPLEIVIREALKKLY